MKNFKDIQYLQSGNEQQQRAFADINRLRLFEILAEYNPILTGTIPIGIDLPESDLDIVCRLKPSLKNQLEQQFSKHSGFNIYTTESYGVDALVCTFRTNHFAYEFFAQDLPSEEQFAYRHMIIEHEILERMGESFRLHVLRLKQSGMKTESTFAQLLGLAGDPYTALLDFDYTQL